MGRITKDNLSDELINEIEEIAGNATAELLNEAKALIANAVGEPLTAEDSFSKMSNDINNLTSDFKIGLMNGGMAVESTDRFQDLILKMKEMINGDIDVDAALYDSLKSVLEADGVEILETDDMATLITKAGDKITEKNTEISNMVLPEGDAVASNVASGKTFINNTGKLITGTLANVYAITAGTTLTAASNTAAGASYGSSTNYTNLAPITITYPGTYTVKVGWVFQGNRSMDLSLRKNGSDVWLLQSGGTSENSNPVFGSTNGTWYYKSVNLTLAAGDKLTLYPVVRYSSSGSFTNFSIAATFSLTKKA